MTTSEFRQIVEEKLSEYGIQDEDALEITDSIVEALIDEGFFGSRYDEDDDSDRF